MQNYAEAFGAAWAGRANAATLLSNVAADPNAPAIARASALTELAPYISPANIKLALAAVGVDQLVTLRFNEQMREMTPETFVDRLLVKGLGARHIVAHAGDRPFTKQWMIDELRPYSAEPRAWGDMVADLVDGDEPEPFARGDWPAPACAPFEYVAVAVN